MATRKIAVTQTPINLITELSLVEDQAYKVTVSGANLVQLGDSDSDSTPPEASHPLYPPSPRADHKEYILVESGSFPWAWSDQPSEITITEVE